MMRIGCGENLVGRYFTNVRSNSDYVARTGQRLVRFGQAGHKEWLLELSSVNCIWSTTYSERRPKLALQPAASFVLLGSGVDENALLHFQYEHFCGLHLNFGAFHNLDEYLWKL